MAGTKKTERRKRIKYGIRKIVSGTPARPRLSVFRSNRGIYAQLVDDTRALTLTAVFARRKNGKGQPSKTAQAREAGKRLAEKARKAGIESVVFDRSGYLYHGRVKALAEGAREGGLKF